MNEGKICSRGHICMITTLEYTRIPQQVCWEIRNHFFQCKFGIMHSVNFLYLMSFLFCIHVQKNRTCFSQIQCFRLVFHCPVFQHFKDSILLSSVLNFSDQNLCFTFCLIIYNVFFFFPSCCFDNIFRNVILLCLHSIFFLFLLLGFL